MYCCSRAARCWTDLAEVGDREGTSTGSGTPSQGPEIQLVLSCRLSCFTTLPTSYAELLTCCLVRRLVPSFPADLCPAVSHHCSKKLCFIYLYPYIRCIADSEQGCGLHPGISQSLAESPQHAGGWNLKRDCGAT